jgi:uncharacterized protein YgbK (DUF1537 family)
LPAVWGQASQPEMELGLPLPAGLGLLVVAGSLMPQTQAQVAQLKAAGALPLVLNGPVLPDPQARERHLAEMSAAASAGLRAGRDVLVHSSQEAEAVEQTRRAGAARGLTPTQTARLVSESLAEVTARVVAETGLNRLAIAGGETSAAVCARLGVTGMRIWKEIQPGLPSCLSLTHPALLLVLKSGSFGSPDFLERALEHLREQ